MGIRIGGEMKFLVLFPLFIACSEGCSDKEEDSAAVENAEPAEDSAE